MQARALVTSGQVCSGVVRHAWEYEGSRDLSATLTLLIDAAYTNKEWCGMHVGIITSF